MLYHKSDKYLQEILSYIKFPFDRKDIKWELESHISGKISYYIEQGYYEETAHEHSERSIHYGPSEVVHIEDFDEGKYILCKYDKWISCNTVNRELLFFWRFGNQPTGFENDRTKVLDYTWGASRQYYKLYGIINDNIVKKVEIIFDNGKLFAQTNFYDDLFLFTWKSNHSQDWNFKSIKGYDSDNNVIFEEEY